jgi:hypothetical protein
MTTFTDDFNSADSTNLGVGWVEVSGDWSIVSNQLSPGAAGGTIIMRAAGAMASNDNSAQATIASTTVASQGVWCRGNSNITSGYLWRNNGTSWDLFSVVGGSFTVIGTYTAAAAPGDVAKVQAVGSTIKGFVNGIERVSVVNTAVATGTSVGIRSDSAGAIRFDDFTGADVVAGSTGDAALSGTATLSASGLRAATGGAALASTAGLAAAGIRASAGAAALAPTAALTAGGVRAASGGADLASTAGLLADGTRGTSGDASLAAAAAPTAAGLVGRGLDAALTATVALTAAGAIGSTSGGGATVSVGLTASGQVAGVVARGTARGAAGARPRSRRGEPAVPVAQSREPAVPTARGGVL